MADVVVRVRERRGALGLSQADLAGRIGISRQALAAVESGRSVPSTTVALGLARALGCAVEDLFGLLPDVMRPVQVAPADRVVLGCVDGRWVAHPAPADRPADGRVRPDGTELLADPEVLSERVLLAGCAPLLGLLEASWLPTTSTAALQLLARGEVHVAGLHLASDAEGHAELARSAVEAPVVVNVTRWQQGLVLAAGNPLGIRGPEDLRRPGLRVAHRPAGAGAQRVLERAFAGAPVPPGPLAADHEEVARMVRWGVVDVGVAIEPVALAHGLPFLPLAEERFDLVVPAARLADPRIARLLERLSGARFRADASGLPGYDLALVGQTFGGGLIALLLACTPGDAVSVEVFAASSLADVMGDLAESFEAEHPDVDVRVTSAGSQVLRLQIEEGAPADLFASADPSHARVLAEAGLLGSPEVLAHNALVAVVPEASPLRTFDDLRRASRIVVGTPNVPVGAYTREVLERARTVRGDAFAEAIAGSIVSEEPNVRLVRAKVELGEADAAFVYRTDVSPGLRAIPLPEALAVRATHVVAARPEASREAQAFFAWALGPTGDAALLDHGFDPLIDRALTGLGAFLAAGLLALLVLPLLALVVASSPTAVAAAVADPAFLPALGLSLATSASSVAVIVLAGTPLAWWLATSGSRWVRPVGLLVDLPLVVPPAALGIALLQAFGRRGLFGPALAAVGVQLPFTPAAVVVAQVVVAAPFYVQAAVNAFRDVDPEVLLVARTLGAGPAAAFGRVALPIALPGLVGAASLAWARALGELGATLLFAGSLPGRTTTLPLAVLTALESDVQLAVVLALALVALGGLLLGVLRAVPTWRP